MNTCLVSEVECLGYSEHNGVGFLLASTAEHKTVEPEEQGGKEGEGREGRDRGRSEEGTEEGVRKGGERREGVRGGREREMEEM